MTESRLAQTAAAVGILFVAFVYLPGAGVGFVKDDFAWIPWARATEAQPLSAFVQESAGTFYRPIVTLSFLLDFRLHGLASRGYGLTNLLLLAACALGVACLGRTLRLGPAAAAIGALVWVINPHGVNMAVLWISGRTSLLMTLFSCFSVVAFLRGWRPAGAVLLLAALLSKEDAIALPLIVACARWLDGRPRRALAVDTLWMAAAAAVYLWLRMGTEAITPATAPAFYRLTSDPALILRNLVAYLDRSATGAAVVALLALGVYRVRPSWTPDDRRRLLLALVWFIAGIAITVRIPVRSSLYALFPSVAAALACAVAIDALRAAGRDRRRDGALAGVLAATLLLAWAYQPRNARHVEPARVSAGAVHALRADASRLPSQGVVVFEDSPERFANFRDAFGTLAPEAVRLITGKPVDAVVVPAGDRQAVAGEAARYRVDDGRVRREDFR